MNRIMGSIVGLAIIGSIVAFLVFMGSLIYPGSLNWTSGIMCPSDKPDSLVVQDSYSYQPGETTYTFTLYCIGPRGEFEDVGYARPAGILALGAVAASSVVFVLMRAVRAVRRNLGRGRDDDETSPPPDAGTPTAAPPVEDYSGQPPLIS